MLTLDHWSCRRSRPKWGQGLTKPVSQVTLTASEGENLPLVNSAHTASGAPRSTGAGFRRRIPGPHARSPGQQSVTPRSERMDHSPDPRRRRLRRAGLAAAAAAACTAAALYLTVWAAQAAGPAVTVLYKTSTGATADEAEPWFEVVNNTGSAIPYTQLTLRYYFTADANVPYTFACAWAVVGCSNITGTISAMSTPTATADHYLQISFSSYAGSLAAGANSGDMELRLYR